MKVKYDTDNGYIKIYTEGLAIITAFDTPVVGLVYILDDSYVTRICYASDKNGSLGIKGYAHTSSLIVVSGNEKQFWCDE